MARHWRVRGPAGGCDRASRQAGRGGFVPGQRGLHHDAGLHTERNIVERLINKLKAWRGIATRYDKIPESYRAGLQLRASMIWVKDLTQATP